MKEVFEKIIDELKQESIIVDDDAGNRAVEIIKQAAAKYNNGWIPCSEELPTQPEENPVFENKPLELYLVSTRGDKYPFRAFWNGKFFTDGFGKIEAVAWQPLPEPYQPVRNDGTDAGAGYEKSAWRDLILRNFMRGSEA